MGRRLSGESEEVECEVFGRERSEFLSREIKENERKISLRIYIEKHEGRWIERCRVVIFDRWSYRGAIERCPTQSDLDGSRSYQESIEHTETSSMDREAIETNSQKLQWIKIAKTAVEKRRSRGSIDSLAVKRYREAIEIAQKQFFREEKNTDMNAIKHTTQPKIQTTF